MERQCETLDGADRGMRVATRYLSIRGTDATRGSQCNYERICAAGRAVVEDAVADAGRTVPQRGQRARGRVRRWTGGVAHEEAGVHVDDEEHDGQQDLAQMMHG